MSKECVQLHPEDALTAWQRVLPFDEKVDYLATWRAENAYQGLNGARRKKGSIDRNPTLKQIGTVRKQSAVDALLDLFPTEAAATAAACVEVYDEHLPKAQAQKISTNCGGFTKACYTIDPKTGKFNTTLNAAKEKYMLEKKGSVARGYCLSKTFANGTNFRNRDFPEDLQLTQDALRRELAKTNQIMDCTPASS